MHEARQLVHRLARVVEELHADLGLTGGRRGVLQSLAQGGPQTVPQLARARPVSRQHIQSHVNPLLEAGLVELRDNPHHRRSKLVSLTPEGERIVAEIERRERPLVDELSQVIGTARLEGTAQTLRELKDLFATLEVGGEE